MDILSTQDLFDAHKDKYSIGSNSLARFTSSFLGAYNSAIMDLYNWGAITTEPVLLTDLDEDSTLTVRYLPIINVGIKHFLQMEGEWVKGDAKDAYSELNWRRAKGDAADLMDRVNPWGD